MRLGNVLVGKLLAGGCARRRLAALGEVQPFDSGTFLVVIPCLNHYEWQRMGSIEILRVEMQSVFERLTTAARHVPI